MDSRGRKLEDPANGAYHKAFRGRNGNLQRIESYENDSLSHSTIFVNTIAEAQKFAGQNTEDSGTEYCLLTAVAGKYRRYEQFNLGRTALLPI